MNLQCWLNIWFIFNSFISGMWIICSCCKAYSFHRRIRYLEAKHQQYYGAHEAYEELCKEVKRRVNKSNE